MNRYFQTPPVVKNLIIINVLVYMATALLPVGDTIMQYCALSLGTPYFHTYQFITYMFLHANFEHIFFNMFALWMFGRTLEYELGSQRFLTFYMVCGVGAALIQYLTALAFGELPLLLVGASGAVMGLLLGQCIGRWANFINREAFGAETTLPWRMCGTSIAEYLLQSGYVDQAGYEAVLSGALGVHPTFFYESMWNLAGLFLVYQIGKRWRKYDGECFLFYLCWYGLGRAWIEGLRTDSLLIGNTGLRASQLVAIGSVIVAATLMAIGLRNAEGKPLMVPLAVKDLKKQAEAGDRFTPDTLPAGAPHAEFVKATDAMNARLDALDLSEVEIEEIEDPKE